MNEREREKERERERISESYYHLLCCWSLCFRSNFILIGNWEFLAVISQRTLTLVVSAIHVVAQAVKLFASVQ